MIRTQQAPLHPATARLLRWLLLAYGVFVVYGSLVPLNFHAIPLDQAWDRFVHAPFLMLGIGSRADWVANLLLFVPLAFLARAVLPAPAGPAGAGLLALGLWLACTALAAAIEFTQVFFPGRTVSLNDPIAESLGALIGLGLHRLAGPALLGWLAGWWSTESGRPLHTRLLHGYLVALLLMALMPLDLTLSPVEIYHKARQGRVVLLPFADLPHDMAQAVYDLATDVLLWLPVGLLWRWSGRTPVQVLARGALVAGAVELLQLFVWSRVSSSTDLVSGALGCLLGALAAGWGRPAALDAAGAAGMADHALPTSPRTAGAAAPPGRADAGAAAAGPELARRLPWGWLSAVWLGVALAAFWFPFELRLDETWLQQRWQQAWHVPFYNYYQGSEFHALNELLRKLLFFLPGGLLWSLHVAGEFPWRRLALMRAGAASLPLVAVLVEAGQLLMPGKYADITDVCIEAGGAWLGLLLGRRLWLDAGRRAAAPVARPSGPPRVAGVTAVAAARAVITVGDLASIVLLAAALWVAARAPGVPYNVRELMPRSLQGVASALVLAATAWWLFCLPLWQLQRWRDRPEQAVRLAWWLPLQGLPVGVLMLLAVPGESLDDVVGSPVLGHAPALEQLGRYMALHAGLALAATGAVWCVAILAGRAGPRPLTLLTVWLLVLLLWCVPVHLVVVTGAATDNLVELMRDGGSPGASALLFCGLWLLVAAASALAVMAAAGVRRRWPAVLLLAALGVPAGLGLLWMGSEPLLLKYGKAFSAAQFLLSADRDHYVDGVRLASRAVLASAGLAGLIVALQWHRWRPRAAASADADEGAHHG